jgi:hypothetical protein
MGYYLQAFICKTTDADCLTNVYDKAISVDMGQGVSLIPMTENLFDQINEGKVSADVGDLVYMTENIEHKILTVIGARPFSYVEAEYFGGQGAQEAIIWQDGKRFQLLPSDQDRINHVLKYFGVVVDKGGDEFNALGFGRHRYTENWIDEVNNR